MQTAIGCDRGAGYTQVNAKGRPAIGKLNVVQFQDDVQGELASTIHQVGSGDTAADKRQHKRGDGEGNLRTSCNGSEIDEIVLPGYRNAWQL